MDSAFVLRRSRVSKRRVHVGTPKQVTSMFAGSGMYEEITQKQVRCQE